MIGDAMRTNGSQQGFDAARVDRQSLGRVRGRIMAQVLEAFPAREYNWDEWLDGEPRVLIRGEDFDTDPASMRVTVYRAATRRGQRVRTMIEGDTLVIQRRNPEF